jgi:branched-chain amino acid transport system ATP-binding protein
MAETFLKVSDLHSYYGLNHILFGISLNVHEGEAVALVGRNGMGKTTTLKSIMGLLPPRSGSVWFRGSDITGHPPHANANRGLGYVPEERRIFLFLTVLENLKVAQKNIGRGWTMDKVFELFPHLKGLKTRKGCHLSGGEQQMLTIARTLMGNPELILLDEPFEGLAPLIIQDLVRRLVQIKKEGIVMLLSEQNLSFAGPLLDFVYIIEKGEIRYHGSFQEFQENESVKKAYLGI